MSKKRPLGPVIVNGVPMRYSKGVVANGFVFLTGLDGVQDDDGNPVKGIAAQTRLALDRGKQRLEEAGSSIENIVMLDHYLANVSDQAEYHVAREGWLRENAPGLAADKSFGGCLVQSDHVDPDRLIEFRVIAIADEG